MADPQTIAVPIDVMERLIHEHARIADAFEASNRDVAPHLKRLREIEEAREAARARADAERLEGRSAIAKLFTSTPAIIVYTAVATLIANYAMGVAGIAPQAVKDGMSEEHVNAGTP